MLQEDNSYPCVATSIPTVQRSCQGIERTLWVIIEADIAGTESCTVFFDLYPCSDDRSHIHPLVLLGVRAQQCVCCLSRTKDIPPPPRKKTKKYQPLSKFILSWSNSRQSHLQFYNFGIWETFSLVNFISQQKEQAGIFLYLEEIFKCKRTVVLLFMECRIFGQCQHEILLLDKTSGR